MSILKGKNLNLEILGESHAPEMVVKVKGFPKFTFDSDKLNCYLKRRKASSSAYSTPRIESDNPIFNGVENSTVDGDFEVVIKNENVKSKDYSELYGKPRPWHADYAWFLKDGALDFSGGGRFSARLTAPYCEVGGLAKQYLEKDGIYIASYIQKVGSVSCKSYLDGDILYEDATNLPSNFPSLTNGDKMLEEIERVRAEGDSVGGIVEVIVYGMKAGVGDNLFDGLEGKISSLLFSVPAVKGVEFGLGFLAGSSRGSNFNDELYFDNGNVKLKTNNNGGINGGISNGFNITMRVAIKPTPSIAIEQNTVDLINKENVKIKIKGRHDACVAVRALPCIESAVAMAILDEVL